MAGAGRSHACNGALLTKQICAANLRSAPKFVPRRGTLWEGGARLLTARLTVTCGDKTHWKDVRLGAENRAKPHILRQLGA